MLLHQYQSSSIVLSTNSVRGDNLSCTHAYILIPHWEAHCTLQMVQLSGRYDNTRRRLITVKTKKTEGKRSEVYIQRRPGTISQENHYCYTVTSIQSCIKEGLVVCVQTFKKISPINLFHSMSCTACYNYRCLRRISQKCSIIRPQLPVTLILKNLIDKLGTCICNSRLTLYKRINQM